MKNDDRYAFSVPEGVNYVVLIKESERFYYLYRDHQRRQIVEAMQRDVRDPELSFTEHDYLVLAKSVLGDDFPLDIEQAMQKPRSAMRRLFDWLKRKPNNP